MIVHVFNSTVVSGPETLVIPALPRIGEKAAVVFLRESRCGDRALGLPAYARSFGLETIEIVVRSRLDPKAVSELRKVLTKLSPRIVHAHDQKPSAYVAAASPKNRSYHIVTTDHGVRAKKAWKLWLYEWIYARFVMPRFDRVLTVCRSDRELLINRGVPAEKVHVHVNGVDRPKVPAERRSEESVRIRTAWELGSRGVDGKAICLGLVGRLAPEKRHSFVLHVMRELVSRRPDLDIHLVVFGIGQLAEVLASETRELGLEKRVHWMGYRNTVGAETAGFDLLLSLSFAEGLPINIVEAGWAGTPVFATAVDGILDLVPSAEYGTLVDPGASETEVAEKLAQTLSDPAALKRSGVRLQQRVEEFFSGKIWIQRLLEVYLF